MIIISLKICRMITASKRQKYTKHSAHFINIAYNLSQITAQNNYRMNSNLLMTERP